MPTDWFEAFVATVPGVQGGAPVIRGTRTPVGSIISYLRTYGGDQQEVQTALPHLTGREIQAAIAYYACHKAEVDADLREHSEAREQFLRAV